MPANNIGIGAEARTGGRKRQLLGAAGLFAIGLLLASCQNGPGTICSGEVVDTPFSDCGHNQIDDQPRLANGEDPRRGAVIDVRRLNAETIKANGQPFVGYVGTMKVNFSPDPARVAADVIDIGNASSKNFDDTEMVKVDLNDASIDFMLRQLLGGALGVNYIAPADLPGTVTFRTERPIPKSQLLEVVRDILARNNLVMQYFNGVYHIGPAELIAALDANGAQGRRGDTETRTIKLRGRDADRLVELAVQIVPQSVRLLPASDGRSVIVQASPKEADDAEELIRTLSGYGAGENRVAIVPLRMGEPTIVAQQVLEFYGSQFPDLVGLLTIVPLVDQQSLLVGVQEAGMMSDLQTLISQLDRGSKDAPQVRIIPLQHLKAEEVATQLQEIFGGGAAAAAPSDPVVTGSNRSNRDSSATEDDFRVGLRPNLKMDAPLGDSEEQAGGDLRAPQVVMERPNGNGRIDNEGSMNGETDTAAFDNPDVTVNPANGRGPASEGGPGMGPKIVANVRTNSVMVYSTFDEFKQVKDVLETLDVPQSQVVIEATVVEVDLSDQLDKGVQWFLEGEGFAARSSRVPAPVDPGGAGGVIQAGGTIGNVRADVVLNALQAVTKVKVISSPYLTVVDGKSARLVIGDQIPYAVRSQSSNNSGNVTVTEEIEVKDTGIILEVTPLIYANNSVSLKVNQQVSTPSNTIQQGDNTPVIATRNIESEILVQSGRTVLLGGLIQDRLEQGETGVPVLRTIPAVGELFKQRNDRARRVELLVMITPRVVRQSSQLEDITRLLRSHMHTRPKGHDTVFVKP